MKDLDTVPYHPISEKIVDVLCQKTQNTDRNFFRLLVAYYFAKVASTMRVNIETHERGAIPVNLYAINLAESGHGKGHSTNIIEDEILCKFREKFLEYTFPAVADKSLDALAAKRAMKKGTDMASEKLAAEVEFSQAGTFVFSFDSATSAAIKQMRHKLLMAGAGSVNMEIDEIGSNLLGNMDALNVFFELFDIGKVKQKLTKNTSDNTRNEEIIGYTPTNMLLFGTPSKLFDGSKTENEAIDMLEAGMARRCFFAVGKKQENIQLTPQEVYDMMTNTQSSTYLISLADKFERLADVGNFGVTLEMSKDVSLLLIEYKLHCEKLAQKLSSHENIKRYEMSHRYFKVLKLAGAYAFIDESPVITEDHIYNAIRLAETSGQDLNKLLKRDKSYVKLAKYIAEINKEVTHVDLVEELPFYKGSESQKREMMNYAITYGYKNNIIIKKHFVDGIEFLKGETLQKTDMDNMTVSYSNHIAYNYQNKQVPFTKLHQLTQRDGYHWCAHQFIDQHRQEDSVIEGFNLVVIDVDEGVSMDTAKLLLKDYTYLMYTTKRHTDKDNRFRIVLPMSHNLKLSKPDYAEFMQNVYEWLPFDVDTATTDRSRKWLSHNGSYEYNDGAPLDTLLFIPKTAKNDERKQFVADNRSLSNMERWFLDNTGTGNRSNQFIKYALLLVDAGFNLVDIRDKLIAFNAKLSNPMPNEEITDTVLLTTSKKITERDKKKQ